MKADEMVRPNEPEFWLWAERNAVNGALRIDENWRVDDVAIAYANWRARSVIEECAQIAEKWPGAISCGKVIHQDRRGPVYRCGFIEGHHGECETLDQREGRTPMRLPRVGSLQQQIAERVRALASRYEDTK